MTFSSEATSNVIDDLLLGTKKGVNRDSQNDKTDLSQKWYMRMPPASMDVSFGLVSAVCHDFRSSNGTSPPPVGAGDIWLCQQPAKDFLH